MLPKCEVFPGCRGFLKVPVTRLAGVSANQRSSRFSVRRRISDDAKLELLTPLRPQHGKRLR